MKPILTACLLLIFFEATAQRYKDLSVDFMVRGYVHAASAVEDTQALGGFGGSDNIPKSLNAQAGLKASGFYLFVDTTSSSVFAKEYNGYKMFLVNSTNDVVELSASDSRLPVIAEALVDNRWQPIEYLPRSGCGNSYHRVYLKPNQYWEFDVPRYAGKLQTKLRYKFALSKDEFLYSNVFTGSINKKQWVEKQGHNPTGIMDPYNE